MREWGVRHAERGNVRAQIQARQVREAAEVQGRGVQRAEEVRVAEHGRPQARHDVAHLRPDL